MSQSGQGPRSTPGPGLQLLCPSRAVSRCLLGSAPMQLPLSSQRWLPARSSAPPRGRWCWGLARPSPPNSVFQAWLSQLARAGAQAADAQAALISLPRGDERPFVSALPQALLANPQGPLAIIGHSDLAWVFSFSEVDEQTGQGASRILSALMVLSNGSRAGVALDALMRFYREVNDQLMAGYQSREDAESNGESDPTDPVRHGLLWMQRNDLRGYLLLGEPAARLPVKRMGP